LERGAEGRGSSEDGTGRGEGERERVKKTAVEGGKQAEETDSGRRTATLSLGEGGLL